MKIKRVLFLFIPQLKLKKKIMNLVNNKYFTTSQHIRHAWYICITMYTGKGVLICLFKL